MTEIIGKTYKIRVHDIELPLPTEDAQAMFGQAVQPVRGPLGQQSFQLMVTPATAALWIETRNALSERDKRIAELEADVERLRKRLESLEDAGFVRGAAKALEDLT